MKRLLLALPMMLLISCEPCLYAFIDQEALKTAIYQAEGGTRAKKPYGVLSVKCEGKEGCGRIVDNSIRNNLKRWKKQGGKHDVDAFIAFFGARWCPIGVKNDPLELNKNWVGNVSSIYNKIKS